MSLPKPGDSVKVVMRGETFEGTVEWIDGNGAWVKNPQKARWVPLEVFIAPAPPEAAKKESPEE